jgi:hypothetical protein
MSATCGFFQLDTLAETAVDSFASDPVSLRARRIWRFNGRESESDSAIGQETQMGFLDRLFGRKKEEAPEQTTPPPTPAAVPTDEATQDTGHDPEHDHDQPHDHDH